MSVIQHLVFSFIIPSLLILVFPTPAWSNNSSTMQDMMEDMGRMVPTECYTPPDLENIFIRACEKVLNDNTQCQSVWEKFSSAFGYKDPNNITGDDYDDYFAALPVVSVPSTTIFWSAVKDVIEEISEYQDISSSFNQQSSSIINAMITDDDVQCWCGNVTHLLDTDNPCPMLPGPTTVFWQQFSCLLGDSASGTSFWIGYGDKVGGAYQSTSFFANYEFPKLTPDRVNRLVAIDMYNCNSSLGEKCGEGTLIQLQNQAIMKYGSAGYQCYEVCGDPQDEEQVPLLAKDALNIIRNEQESEYICCCLQ